MPIFPIPRNPVTPVFNFNRLPIRGDLFSRAPPNALIRALLSVKTGEGLFRSQIVTFEHNPTVEEFFAEVDTVLEDFLDKYPWARQALADGTISLDELLEISEAWRKT